MHKHRHTHTHSDIVKVYIASKHSILHKMIAVFKKKNGEKNSINFRKCKSI